MPHADGARGLGPRTRARKGEGDRLREDILEAAERLLVETGDESAVSIRAIARAVGCTPPAIYLHFADKDELFYEVCELRFRQLNEALERAEAGVDDPVEALKRGGRAYVRFGLDSPEHYRVLMMTKHHATVDQVMREDSQGMKAFSGLVGSVQRCIDAGAFRPLDATTVAVGLWATVHGLTSLLISSPDFPWPVATEELIKHVVDGHIEGLLLR